ncbi:MAG: ATP synthase F0 subunit C [Dehalococcoidales bacterium]|nr:ATP synthase F0 subunit C [Dehalococcoidales bacterium]
MDPATMKLLAVGLAASLGLMGPALAIGLIGYSALQGLARNPEAGGRIQTAMILVTAFAEAIGIYALIIALILAFV